MSDKVLLAGGWRLWSQFALRGPGFPAAGVLRLAPAGLGLAADKFRDGPVPGPEWDSFEDFFGTAAVGTAGVLQEIAASPAFQAAVTWQNRAVIGSGIRSFLAWRPSVAGRTSMPRQREELVAHYWQRFCVKNDTIGFFGPVGWGADRYRAGWRRGRRRRPADRRVTGLLLQLGDRQPREDHRGGAGRTPVARAAAGLLRPPHRGRGHARRVPAAADHAGDARDPLGV
nr:hypothetical protein GCM10020092_035340 [Actinoplanes digitatis]